MIRSGRPQPDAREGDEACMAVLNNFYGDGIIIMMIMVMMMTIMMLMTMRRKRRR